MRECMCNAPHASFEDEEVSPVAKQDMSCHYSILQLKSERREIKVGSWVLSFYTALYNTNYRVLREVCWQTWCGIHTPEIQIVEKIV